MTTNIIESLNAMLIEEREYFITSIFNSIAKRFGELVRERHAYFLKSNENIRGQQSIHRVRRRFYFHREPIEKVMIL
ncbi:hypothetical protein H5410_026765 [Solanum commersonii]|uniref:Uncharacterized protein n=1 Tax=Solanum commersonii TaxID=4109 RepID=A0A9J5YXF7_SOLCO|nr:hypothetical protein H5410_026765 [Solanum commersonii]